MKLEMISVIIFNKYQAFLLSKKTVIIELPNVTVISVIWSG